MDGIHVPIQRARPTVEAPEPTVLYRFYDAGGLLLYVGITVDMTRRIYHHKRRSRWFPLATTCRLEHFPTRRAAAEAEVLAIETERPHWNRRHSIQGSGPRPRPAKPVKPRPRKLATPAEAAKELGVAVPELRSLCADALLQVRWKIGGRQLLGVSRESVEMLKRAQQTPPGRRADALDEVRRCNRAAWDAADAAAVKAGRIPPKGPAREAWLAEAQRRRAGATTGA